MNLVRKEIIMITRRLVRNPCFGSLGYLVVWACVLGGNEPVLQLVRKPCGKSRLEAKVAIGG
jgi:hypothetical protein